MKKTIYLDNNATTQVAEEVVEEMLPYFHDLYGNPSSMHSFGGQVHRNVEQARENVAALLGAQPDEIVFTSCGTESDNAAVMATLDRYPEKRHFVTTRVEHPAVWNLCPYLRSKDYRISELSVDRKGRLDLDELRSALSDDTALVSVMYANNETGVIFPIEEIGQIVKARGIPFHTDAVQAVGKIPLDMSESTVDMLSLSGHKLHAPKGIGVLYLRRGTRYRPLLRGGHQERGRRAGTENAAAIVGLGVAADLARAHLEQENTSVRRLRDTLEQGILARVPHTFVTGDTSNRLPNTSNIAFEFVEGEGILLLLNQLGIAASSGSACTSGSLEPSHVMRAMDIPYTAAHGTIRFSLSRYTTQTEIGRVIEAVPPIIARLRKLSPYWTEQGPVTNPHQAFQPVYS